MNAHFYKYQALGNDMVVIDPARFDFPLTPPAVRLICDRHFGLGADGICYGPLLGEAHPRPGSADTDRCQQEDGTGLARTPESVTSSPSVPAPAWRVLARDGLVAISRSHISRTHRQNRFRLSGPGTAPAHGPPATTPGGEARPLSAVAR